MDSIQAMIYRVESQNIHHAKSETEHFVISYKRPFQIYLICITKANELSQVGNMHNFLIVPLILNCTKLIHCQDDTGYAAYNNCSLDLNLCFDEDRLHRRTKVSIY